MEDSEEEDNASHISATPSVTEVEYVLQLQVKDQCKVINIALLQRLLQESICWKNKEEQLGIFLTELSQKQIQQSERSLWNSALVDEHGFQRALTKSQMRNWRKKMKKDKQRLEPIPYGPRSRARNNGNR